MGRKNSYLRWVENVGRVAVAFPALLPTVMQGSLCLGSEGEVCSLPREQGRRVPEQLVEGEYPCILWRRVPEEGMLMWTQKE